MSNLVTHAKKELEIAGLFDHTSDYGGMIGASALEIVEKFSEQGHSGYSAALVTDIVTRLMRFQPLTPLTSDPEEWQEVTDNLWQNRRDFAVFSRDGGTTWYHLDDPTKNNGDTWQREATSGDANDAE